MKLKQYVKEIDIKGWLLILLGTVTWSLTMVKSGLVYNYGMGFWGPNGHDGIWHIAIINSLAKGSWQMPIFAGKTINNYHIGFDLIVAIIHKLTFIPVNVLYFQLIPVILALLIGIFAYKFIYVWQKDRAKAYWSTFFIYFGGSFGWVVTLIRDRTINGESLFWSQQSTSTLINPPFALSLLIIFIGLEQLVLGIRNKNKKRLIIATFSFGLLVQIKVYAGILILIGLFTSGIWRMLKRKGIALIKVFTGALIVSILIFSPLSENIPQVIIFKPFWFLETMMEFRDRFGWQRYAEAMVNYKSSGNLIKGIPAYLFAFLLFWTGNSGARVIKISLFIKHIKNFKRLSFIDVLIYSVIGIGILIPTFFIQRGTAWNTIQFIYYSLMFSGILAGIAFVHFDRKFRSSKLKRYFLEGIVLAFSIVSAASTLRHYLPSRPPAKISKEELMALDFLKNQPDGVVLTQPFDRQAALNAINNPPRPLYLYESTAYVSAFSEKPVYLEDEVNLEITGYDWRERRNQVIKLFSDQDISENSDFLGVYNISYIYWIKNRSKGIKIDQDSTTKIFENEEVIIYNTHTEDI